MNPIEDSDELAEAGEEGLRTPSFVLGVSVIGLCVLTGFHMGQHDIIAGLLVAIVAYPIFMRVYDLRIGIKKDYIDRSQL